MSTNSILATAPLVTTNFLLRATGTTIGNSLIFDNGTNVGIGNTNTSFTLDVSGTGRFTGALTAAGLTLTTAGSTSAIISGTGTNVYSSLSLTNTTTGYGYDIGFGGSASIAPNSFYIYGGSSASVKFLINSSGNVGIGTSSPASLLHIFGSGSGNNVTYTKYTCGDGGDIRVGKKEGVSNDAIFGTWSNNDVLFYGNQTERMRITSAGNVAIASGGNVEIGNGYLSTSAGSGTAYSSKLSTVYTFPYIDTFLDSIAGASYQSRLRFRLNTAAGAMEDKLILWYDGTITFSGLAGSGTRTVTVLSSGNLSTSSDSKLKQEDKEYVIGGLKELLKITPRAYKWLSEIEKIGEEATTELGFFADEVAPIIPSAAPKGNDDMYGFNDRALMAVMVKSIQELTERLIKLENK
jgi:hypothetical protein